MRFELLNVFEFACRWSNKGQDLFFSALGLMNFKYRKVYNNNFDTGIFDMPLYTDVASEEDIKKC